MDKCAYCGKELTGSYHEMTSCGESFCGPSCLEKWNAESAFREAESSIRYVDQPQLDGDWMVASDWHIPFHDTKWVMKLIEIAERYKVHQLLIPGDFINADEYAYFPAIVRSVTIEEEMSSAKVLFGELAKYFSRMLWLPGNHEARITKFVKGTMPTTELMKMFFEADQVEVSPYPYAVIKGPNGELTGRNAWHITHPGNYSGLATRVAQRLADQTMRSTLAGHGHMGGMASSPNLGLVAGDLCMMADEKKFAYRQLVDRINSYWQNGFWMIRNGYGYLFWQHTDWSFWLEEKHKAEHEMEEKEHVLVGQN